MARRWTTVRALRPRTSRDSPGAASTRDGAEPAQKAGGSSQPRDGGTARMPTPVSCRKATLSHCLLNRQPGDTSGHVPNRLPPIRSDDTLAASRWHDRLGAVRVPGGSGHNRGRRPQMVSRACSCRPLVPRLCQESATIAWPVPVPMQSALEAVLNRPCARPASARPSFPGLVGATGEDATVRLTQGP
jgi:hypothetical protein